MKKKDIDQTKEGELEKVTSGVYDGLTKEQILKRMAYGGEEEVKKETPLEAWMRLYSMTKEEILIKFPGKFNKDGSFKGGE